MFLTMRNIKWLKSSTCSLWSRTRSKTGYTSGWLSPDLCDFRCCAAVQKYCFTKKHGAALRAAPVSHIRKGRVIMEEIEVRSEGNSSFGIIHNQHSIKRFDDL